MIIQRKLYSSSQLSPEEQIKKLKNMTPAQRYSTIGITTVAGAAPGLLLRSGKLAAIGGALGAGAGLYFTSKHSRDKQIKKLEREIENRKKLSQSYVNNFKSEKRKELQDIKKEYGSKLLNVPETVMYDIFPNSIEYELDDNIKYGDGDKFCCAVLIDPSQADDHFIVYHPKTGKYGFDITEEDGKYSSLKDAIVDLCKDNIDFLNTSGKQFDKDGSLVDLYNRWLKFIKSKL